MHGGAGAANALQGGPGNDTYYVTAAGDSIIEFAGEGFDSVVTNLSYYLLPAHVENLYASGGGGMIGLGSDNPNYLEGNDGNDTLNGKLGADTMTGGAGFDYFMFDTALGGGNIDRILDFTPDVDRFLLKDTIFGLPMGVLNAAAFRSGAAAADADDRIIYNPATGQVLFDADGNGPGAAIQFALIATGLNIGHDEFIVT